jgi:hypothetical protein
MMMVFAFLAPACSSVSALCSKICECQHCNDYTEKVVCEQMHGEAAIAKDYGCESQHSDYINCLDDKGQCHATAARYVTRTPGRCSNGKCEGSMTVSCKTDSNCPDTGEDKCESQKKALSECQSAASASH